MENKDNCISNGQIEVTITKPTRVIHFSDGIEEEISEERVTELKSEPKQEEVDLKSLEWGPWFSHYAYKSSNKVLNAIDYAGESLANFFGITTPKYQIEVDEYERIREEKKKMEEESAGWLPKNAGGDVPLVLNEPSRDLDRVEHKN